MERESWQSRIGFIFAAVGSAVGLANIWKFPYIVGKNGGAAFIAVYLICLLFIGFPVLVAEILIGRKTKSNPSRALASLGGGKAGLCIIATGFIVSSFYSVVAGWILGYFIEACLGNLTTLKAQGSAANLFHTLVASPLWAVGFHFLFMFFCVAILFRGVRKGIERATSYIMPLLFFILIGLVINGLMLPNADKALQFLFSPNWSQLTPMAIITALGHSFFTLSVGQGTMITYGSYLSDDDSIPGSCLPIALADTLISLLAAVAIFTVVFSVGAQPTEGPSLLFETLPHVFSHLPGGYFAALFFFFFVFLAALTSEISAMEPCIAYLVEERGFSRGKAVLTCGGGAFVLGIPSALSLLFLDRIDFFVTSVMIPLGGFVAVVVIGWRWGASSALRELLPEKGSPLFSFYFSLCFKYLSPLLIVLVFLHALGILSL